MKGRGLQIRSEVAAGSTRAKGGFMHCDTTALSTTDRTIGVRNPRESDTVATSGGSDERT